MKHNVLVEFSIGAYKDKVVCDVVPMKVSHLLLGRPWEYDKHASNSGQTNRYSFMMLGVKFMLTPLRPHEVHHDQVGFEKRYD